MKLPDNIYTKKIIIFILISNLLSLTFFTNVPDCRTAGNPRQCLIHRNDTPENGFIFNIDETYSDEVSNDDAPNFAARLSNVISEPHLNLFLYHHNVVKLFHANISIPSFENRAPPCNLQL
jgi:hypothetical protein